MGQQIDQDQRRKMQSHPHVAQVTQSHVILRDGRVLDPAEFVVERQPVKFILKLITCRCVWKKHSPGTHAIIKGHVLVYGTGRLENSYKVPGWCKRGNWLLEELVPAARVIVRS